MYLEKATFAGGNFNHLVQTFIDCPGVKRVIAGYIGGSSENPSYEEVITGTTGHYLAVEVHYNAQEVPYYKLLDLFWRTINPTDDAGQFTCRGNAFRTSIFYHSEEQLNFARITLDLLNTGSRFKKPIMTSILPATLFYPADDVFQENMQSTLSCPFDDNYEKQRKQFLDMTWRKSYRKLLIKVSVILFPCLLILMIGSYAWSVNARYAPWSKTYPEPIRDRILTAEEVYSDFKWLVSIVEQTHPIFLDHEIFYNKTDIRKAYDLSIPSFLEQARHTMSVIDFVLFCNRYLALLSDAHTRVSSPSGGSSLPLAFHWDESGLFMKPTSVYPEGAEVLKIGGLSIETLGQTIDSHFGIETESGRYYVRSNNASSRIFHQAAGANLDNSDDSIEITLLINNNEISVSFEYEVKNFENSSLPIVENFKLNFIDSETVLVTAYACVKDDSWRATQVSLREAIQGGVQKVIVDIRANSGGDSSVWDPFAVILGLKPYPGYFGVMQRFSPLANATIFRNQRVGSEFYYNPPNKGYVENFSLDLTVLVDEGTFSSAVFLIGYVKDGEYGKIVGREPRNTITHFGYPAQFTMPTSHIQGSISTHYWIRPDKERDKNAEPLLDMVVPYNIDILHYVLSEVENSEIHSP